MIKNRKQLSRELGSVYEWLLKNNPELLNSLLPSQRRSRTAEEVILNAKKYQYKRQWEILDPKYYGKAIKLGIMDICAKHMIKIVGKWDDKTVHKDALKYNSITDWLKASPGAYGYAYKNNKVRYFTGHMKRPKSVKNRPVICVELNDTFSSLKDAADFIKVSRESIGTALRYKTKSGGYHWAYCDEKGNVIK